MEYAEALKEVQTKKPKENYLGIEISHDVKIVLPFKDGMAFITSLANAEQLKDGWGEKGHILSFDRTVLRTFVLSSEEYTRHKIATLLAIHVDEVKPMEAAR